MSDLFRLWGLLRPYPVRLSLLAAAVVLSSLLSSVGVTFISPVLRILFEPEQATQQTELTTPPAAADASLQGWLDGIKADLSDFLRRNLFAGPRSSQLLRVCIWLFCLFFLKNLANVAQSGLQTALEHRAIFDLRRQLFAAITSLPLGWFSQQRTGYVMSRVIVDVDMVRGAVVGGMVTILSNVLMIVTALCIVFAVSWKLSLATLLIVPPNTLLVALISKKLRRGSHRVQEQIGELSAILQESISGIRIVKAFGAEQREAERFGLRNRRYYRAYVKLKLLEALSSPVSEVLGILTAVLILGFGGTLVLRGELSADLLMMFLALMLWVIAPIKQLIKVNGMIQQSLAAARRVFEVLDAPREPIEREGRRDITAPRQGLRFEHVHFAYGAEAAVLHDIDLEVRAGQVVALVGPSGAGKSTLVDLVPRFHEPTSGRVLLDGVDLRDIHLPSLRALIGVVTQEVILFHDTVLNNLRYGQPDATPEQVRAAARAANAEAFIEQLPLGYDTVIGERGTRLSGGQRQRLAIARALLKDPPILILDEATSALDTESERVVQEAMERLMRGRTTLVIAHRLSTVQSADRIVVLEAGRIVESGSHGELVAGNGVYRRLHELQFQSSARAGDSAELAG